MKELFYKVRSKHPINSWKVATFQADFRISFEGAHAYSTCHKSMYAGEYIKGVIKNIA